MKSPYVNPNPRIGVLLTHGQASVRLYNVMNPRFGLRGILWLQRHWTEERMRRELRGYGPVTSREWNNILNNRKLKT